MIDLSLFEEDDVSIPPLPTRETSEEQRNARRRWRIMKIVCLLIVLVISMRMLIYGAIENRRVNASLGPWQRTEATIVGANATMGANNETMLYCPIIDYVTSNGTNITSVINRDSCIYSMNMIGRKVQVRYNPNNPEQVISQEDFEREMNLSTLTIVTGILVSTISGIFLMRVARKTCFGEASRNETTEREELIRSRFYYQKVSRSGKGNVDPAKIRSTWEQVCDSDHHEDIEEGVDTTEESDEQIDREVEEIVGDLPTKGDTPSPITKQLASSSATLLRSSLIRSTGATECAICLEEYQKDEIICTAKRAECNHVFHEKCVTDWLMKNHNQCPLCRTDFLTE